MWTNKILFLLAVPVALSQSQQKHQIHKMVVVANRMPEVINGHIKQLIEIRPDFHTGSQLCSIDTTNFNEEGDIIETRLGEKNRLCLLIRYTNKYDNNERKTETIIYDKDISGVYKFGQNGHVIESTNPGGITIYNYDSKGNMIESINETNSGFIFSKYRFKYSETGLLTQGVFYFKGADIRSKTIYKYLSLDKKGNWLKRVAVHADIKFGTISKDTLRRNITYY